VASRALRWAYANGDGVLVARPGRIHYARLVGILSGAQELAVVLRDGATATDAPVLALDVVNGRPDDWPATAVSVPFLTGLYAQFTGGTAAVRLLMVGWDTD
jgi:hypothetical protein